jgi:signal peptidase II
MLKDFKNKIKFNVGKKSIILIAVCIVLVLVDLFTKIFEERYGWNFTVIPKLIEVESGSRNTGAAFSLLADFSWAQAFLIAMTFVMLILLIGFFIVLPERFTLLKIAVTLISAGAIGNLIDRIAYNEVRDFVRITILGATCNFADFWIVFGTIIAIIDLLFINEWALFPLTKRAKEAQAKREKENVEENKSDKDDGRDNG